MFSCKFAIVLSALVPFGLVSFLFFLFSPLTQDINFNDEISCSVKFLKATYVKHQSDYIPALAGWLLFPPYKGLMVKNT